MLNKYLDLLRKAVDTFGSLGRNSSWVDYFTTIKLEFSVLFISVLIIIGIFIILFAPYKGTVLINEIFEKNKNKFKYFTIIQYIYDFYSGFSKIIVRLQEILDVLKYISEDDEISASDKKKKHTQCINELVNNKSLFDATNSEDFYNQLYNALVAPNEYSVIYDNFYTISNEGCRKRHMLMFLNSWAEYRMGVLSNPKSSDYDKLSEFIDKTHPDNKQGLKKIRKYLFNYLALKWGITGSFYILYAMFVVPLIMMMF